MPRKTKDQRVIDGKKNRNRRIRKRFAALWNDGKRIECIMDILISETGLSESTITQIVKNYGHYNDDSDDKENI